MTDTVVKPVTAPGRSLRASALPADPRYGVALYDLTTGRTSTPGPIGPRHEYTRWLAVSRNERFVGWASNRGLKVWRLAKAKPEEP